MRHYDVTGQIAFLEETCEQLRGQLGEQTARADVAEAEVERLKAELAALRFAHAEELAALRAEMRAAAAAAQGVKRVDQIHALKAGGDVAALRAELERLVKVRRRRKLTHRLDPPR